MILSKVVAMGSLIAVCQVPIPTEENLAHWLSYIRPKAEELAFEASEWKPTFWEAVTEAQQKGKPILLWAMNGHPMACT